MRTLLKSALAGIAAALCITANAQTDVTAQYIVNPSFEADAVASLTPTTNNADGLRGYQIAQPKGWTVENGANAVVLLITAQCYTDNNFGLATTIADGSQAMYFRMGWETGTTRLSQTLQQLPRGSYRLTVSQRSAYANSATSTTTVSIADENTGIAFAAGSQGCFTTMPWQKVSVDFNLTEKTDVNLAFTTSWQKGGSCIMLDDIRLLQLADNYTEPTEQDVSSPTEGVITQDFVGETEMKRDLLQMLANSARYMKDDFQEAQWPNSVDEACGCFRGENSLGSDERGVRPNADLGMICAFLLKYGKNQVTLPQGVSWTDIEQMAMKSLVFAYSTHKANKLKVCSDQKYWGSTSGSDHVWESSLWAMSVAYQAFFLWDKLSETQRNYIYQLLKAECNYELNRTIPTGYAGDTKAEENGWEADVLAATLGLFPNDALAPQWFARLREFAINSYSHRDDANDNTVIDPDYDNTTVAQLYKGQNLYTDYTLQNHDYFHTSYQNVVIQELGEAALALKLFQTGLHGTEKWHTNALMHNNDRVMTDVLYWLALADGELAMPNGNDWSLFLYDQITSYSTNACFLGDPHALMLENLAYKQIKARQTTTADGSWLLRPDVGARRMGVEAHRVMMTWLMHEALPTAAMTPTAWDNFLSEYAEAKVFTTQNIVRAATDKRFTCFSWSDGLKSYTGYIAANSADKNKIVVPFRANNTGNFLGWYEVEGKGTNATPAMKGYYDLQGNSYVMNGELNQNDGVLDNRFAIYSTPGNAVIYCDLVKARQAATINAEYGALMAISTDELTKTQRTLYYANADGDVTHRQSDGSSQRTMNSPWVNIDNDFAIVTTSDKQKAFGGRANNNSIMTSRLYGSYSAEKRSVKANGIADRRAVVYYTGITADDTRLMSSALTQLTTATGWNGAIVPDADGQGLDCTYYLLLCNFAATGTQCQLSGVKCANGMPVFSELTSITSEGSTATFTASQQRSVTNTLRFFISGTGVEAIQDENDPAIIYIRNLVKGNNTITVRAFADGKADNRELKLSKSVVKATIDADGLHWEEVAAFPGDNPSVGIHATPADDAQTESRLYTLGGLPFRSHKTAAIAVSNNKKVIK